MKSFLENLWSWICTLDINVVFTGVVSVVLFFFAFYKDKSFKKKDIYLMRIEKLYAPFYCNCISNELHNLVAFSELSPDTIHEIITHLNNNIQYMGTASQALYPPLYKSALELHYINKHDNSDSEEIDLNQTTVKQKADKTFNEFAKSMFKEYKKLSKTVKLPEPAQLF